MTKFVALADIAHRFDQASADIAAAHRQAITAPTHRERELADYAVIALQDAWTRFVRDVVLASAKGNACRRDGRRIPAGSHGSLTAQQGLDHLRLHYANRRKSASWEPNWYDQTQAARAIDVLAPQNGADLRAAFGAATNPIEELRCVRNFAAHRGRSAAAAIERQHGPRRTWRKVSGVLAPPVLSQDTKPEEWARRFSAVAQAAIQ